MNPSSKSRGGKPKEDWVDDLVNSGLLGHAPIGKFKPKKKVKCSNCRLVGHTKTGCYQYWQDKNDRELKFRNFDDDTVVGGRRKGRL